VKREPSQKYYPVYAFLFFFATIILLLWSLLLSYRLPPSFTVHQWLFVWVGFDLAMASLLAITGVSLLRRSPSAPLFACVVATMLLCDSWFDLTTAWGSHKFPASLLFAVIEISAASFLFVQAHRHNLRQVGHTKSPDQQ